MMDIKTACFLGLLLLAVAVHAKRYSACSLAKDLVKYGIPRSQIPDFVCLAKFESGFNTAALGRVNRNGSRDHGIFQINDKYWCNNGSKPGKDCKITCGRLRDNNIKDDVACAKKIYARHGFNAWYAWIGRCKGKNPGQYLKGCRY